MGGVTRQGVVLTYLLSFVRGSQENLLLLLPGSFTCSTLHAFEYRDIASALLQIIYVASFE